MKVIELCGSGHCPVVKIEDDRVENGEEGNPLCFVLEWERLKAKILSREI